MHLRLSAPTVVEDNVIVRMDVKTGVELAIKQMRFSDNRVWSCEIIIEVLPLALPIVKSCPSTGTLSFSSPSLVTNSPHGSSNESSISN